MPGKELPVSGCRTIFTARGQNASLAELSLQGLKRIMPKRLSLLLLLVFSVSVFTINDAQAGRRGVRVDAGAWNLPQEISLGGGSGACPEAGWDAEVPVFEPGPTIFWGWVDWMGLEFRTSGFQGLDTFTCQTSKPYTPGAQPEEYLNEASFPVDEAGLGAVIGDNTDNAVHAIRYSFTGESNGQIYGRQWTFYFFSNGDTVVALHGVQPAQATYEWIYDHANLQYVWRAEDDPYWDGEYFCFYDGGGYSQFSGTCEPTPPPPPEYIFDDSFE